MATVGEEGFNRTTFLESCLLKHRELSRRQKDYKKILSNKLRTRKETIIEKSLENGIEQLEIEKDELRAQIWVANGTEHKVKNNGYLKQIHCHVLCQEKLSSDVSHLKVSIRNMEHELGRIDKEIYDMNRLTVPDSAHQMHVNATRKKLMILENALEVGVRMECGLTAANAELREQLIRILNYRTFFNQSYTKMVKTLTSDKKYLIDLMEYALNTFDNCIEVYEKIDHHIKRDTKELELRKVEMQACVRKAAADAAIAEFMGTKSKPRELADLQPKEYQRRDKFRREHNKKITLYNRVLEKILEYTQSTRFKDVIRKFQKQESLYYSFFNYANEMSYHITLLNNAVNRLFDDILSLKRKNQDNLESQLSHIQSLEEQVRDKEESNLQLNTLREKNDQRWETLLQSIELLCDITDSDTVPLRALLGDHTHVNLVNFRRFLKCLEKRIHVLCACVYAQEREEELPRQSLVLRDIIKFCEMQTPLDDIVLTQQCPECAEGEAFNIDDGGEGAAVVTIDEAKHKLYEKITQPEMQYRLHSISQCRLPRSRFLAAKRYT